MGNVFETVLLLALPASGKSEVRNLLQHMDPAVRREEFHIGEDLQLDDFPYVHLMRRIDEELTKQEEAGIFYQPGNAPFLRNEDWGTLIHLLNEDFQDMHHHLRPSAERMAEVYFDRLDRASEAVGLPPRMALLRKDVRENIAHVLEPEVRELQAAKESQYPEDFSGKTLVIECARGGPDGATMPLHGADGYQYSLSQFSPAILESAAILYIEVTPEESRRKNAERENPDDPGSNLFHGTPMSVMLRNYGCDDMRYLREQSDLPNTVRVERSGKIYHLPIGIFDNRVDKTSFLREDSAAWEAGPLAEVTAAIREATDAMWRAKNA